MTLPVPDAVPARQQTFLAKAVEAVAALHGIVAVVLGGSYARGTAGPQSDLDLGLYYSELAPFSIAEVRRIATALSAVAPPVVTDFYEWGPWVNGGAWMQTEVGKVDFVYRNVEHVERTIREAQQGIHRHHYNQQPTFGFYSVIYLAETHICVPLFDPQQVVARLKEQVASYPPKLKQAVVADTLWAAEFTFLFARKLAGSADVYNTVGCLTRVAAYLTQALYALNDTYFIGDKGALAAMREFPICPAGYVDDVTHILAHPGATAAQLSRSVDALFALWQEVARLTRGAYQAKYPLG